MLGDVFTQRLPQSVFATLDVNELNLGAGEVDRGRADHNAVDIGARLHDVGNAGAADDDVVGRRSTGGVRNTECARGVSLGIRVDDEDRQAARREPGREVNGGRGLTDAPLLVRDSDDTRVLGARERCALEHGQIAHVALNLIRQRGVVGTHVTPS